MMENGVAYKLVTFYANFVADCLLAIDYARVFNQPTHQLTSQTFIAYTVLLSVSQCYLN